MLANLSSEYNDLFEIDALIETLKSLLKLDMS